MSFINRFDQSYRQNVANQSEESSSNSNSSSISTEGIDVVDGMESDCQDGIWAEDIEQSFRVRFDQ